MNIVKVVRVRFVLIAAMSHPMCAIDEKAIIFRVCVWLSPVHPPVIADSRAKVNRSLGFRWL